MSPQLPYSVTIPPNIIILLHGFNSAPGNKAKEIEEFLSEKKIKDKYKLIAPTIDYEPIKARRDINKIIRQNKSRKVYLIGTSLGGFYANYFRAKFSEDFLNVHTINPSWEPSKSLACYKNKVLENFKTKEKWEFKEDYLSQLKELEKFMKTNLNSPSPNNYHVHLSKFDEVLNFDTMLDFLEKKNIDYVKKTYDTNHRFEKIKEVMEYITKD